MSSIIKVGKVQSSTGQDAVTVADSGAITANGALTASGGIANAGTISAGTINSAVVIQQKTALITGEHTGDFNPVEDSATLYTIKLNTESDPYNFVTLSSNTVTVTEAGTYSISYHTGNLLGWNETGHATWLQPYLEKGGTKLKVGTTANALDLYGRTGNSGGMAMPVGNYVGTLAVNDTLKIRIETSDSDFELLTWTGFTGVPNVYAHMLIQKIG